MALERENRLETSPEWELRIHPAAGRLVVILQDGAAGAIDNPGGYASL